MQNTMQIFVHGSSVMTLDVEPKTTILQVMQQVESKKGGMLVPFQRLTWQSKFLQLQQTLAEIGIGNHSTLFLSGSLAPQLYVKWQGAWLRSKNSGAFKNFWSKLTAENVCKHTTRDIEYECPSIDNLVVYHLQKIVAKFLLLDPDEIALATYERPEEILERNVLLSSLNQQTFAFVANLNVSL
jgi:hypothetical protein